MPGVRRDKTYWNVSILSRISLRKKCLYLELFWSVFSRISGWMWKNAEQDNSECGHFLRSVYGESLFKIFLNHLVFLLKIFAKSFWISESMADSSCLINYGIDELGFVDVWPINSNFKPDTRYFFVTSLCFALLEVMF